MPSMCHTTKTLALRMKMKTLAPSVQAATDGLPTGGGPTMSRREESRRAARRPGLMRGDSDKRQVCPHLAGLAEEPTTACAPAIAPGTGLIGSSASSADGRRPSVRVPSVWVHFGVRPHRHPVTSLRPLASPRARGGSADAGEGLTPGGRPGDLRRRGAVTK